MEKGSGGDRVVVVTGASSGLGRETAVQFAAAGYRVAVAARRTADLENTARACRARGAAALPVEVDVQKAEQVSELVRRVLAEWGRIDVWVNNAGVTLFASLDGASLEEHRAVLETNLFGALSAAREVMPLFVRQGGGTLINVGSVLSHVAQPFVPSYVISKFGLRGLTEALRVQYADTPGVHVCGIYPFSIDTPHFETAGNALPHRARAIPPVQPPERVARAIVKLASRPRPQVFVPRFISLGILAHWFFPRTTERLLLHALRRWHFDPRDAVRTQGGLFRPTKQGSARTRGFRRPRVGAVKFDLWVARDLLRSPMRAWRSRGARHEAPPPPPAGR
jgi:NAD(P)-dependent dehydrogenase (short-subunit alcohol dehydrogenase family)